MFFPGETITHNFVIPFMKNDIAKVIVTYKQNDHIILEKTITSGFEEIDNEKVSFDIAFSQSESLSFQDDSDYTVQLNVLAKSGSRHASHELHGFNGAQYLREVVSNE